MLMRASFLKVASATALCFLISSAAFGLRWRSPFSKASRSSRSSLSSLLLFFFTQILPGRLTAGDNRFQEDFLVTFHVRDNIGIVFDDDDRNLLAGTAPLVWVVENINFVPQVNVDDDILE